MILRLISILILIFGIRRDIGGSSRYIVEKGFNIQICSWFRLKIGSSWYIFMMSKLKSPVFFKIMEKTVKPVFTKLI